MDPYQLGGKTVLVTGASSGIGRRVAGYLASLGARVALTGRDRTRLEAAAAGLEGTGHRVFPMDLGDLDGIPGWFGQVAEAMAPFCGLVHCAGTKTTRSLRRLSPSDLEMEFRINVHAGLLLAKMIRPKAVRTAKASLVFISSVMGLVGAPANTVYSASKGAVAGMVRSLALELAGEGIRVNAISPGFVEGEMLDALRQALDPEQVEKIRTLHPLGFGTPEDVAAVAAFLLGDASRWITGTNLVVDGGYTAQ